MNAPGYLSIRSWPIWFKLLSGFLVAIAVPVAIIMYVVLLGARQVTGDNLESFIFENGRRNETAFASVLQEARNEMNQFVSDPDAAGQLESFLLRGVRSNQLLLDQVNADDINALFQATLLNTSTNIFEGARLLDRNGTLIAQSAGGRQIIASLGQDQSQTVTYLEAANSLLLGRDQSLTVTQRNVPVVEVANAILWRDNRAIGYLVATVNTRAAILDGLRQDNENIPAYSYLITRDNLLFTLPENREIVEAASANSGGVALALAGETGVATYTVGSGGQDEVVGYYAPLLFSSDGDIPQLVLITEAPKGSLFAHVTGFIEARLFVMGVGAVSLIMVLVLLFNQLLTPPLTSLRYAIQSLARGNFTHPITSQNRGDEIGALSTAFLEMREEMQILINDLETRIASRTRDIGATQEISRFAATQRDLQTLLERVVDLIIERFPNIYHAQIFLVDANRQFAVLRASTGEAGQQLLGRGHRLAVGGISVIGQVTSQGRIIVARDAAVSEVHRRNEFLPNTRAELAIPLRVGPTIIGALDVQSRLSESFTKDQTGVLQTMADQIAVAIENARLYQESIRRLEEIERSNRQTTLNAWKEYVKNARSTTLVGEAGAPTNEELSELRRLAIEREEPVIGEPTARDTIPVAAPIKLRGQTLGAIEWEFSAQDFDRNKVLLAQELANRLAISLDNARLFQESQRVADRERIVNEIAAKLSSQTDIDQILQTAVREVGQALRAPDVRINFDWTNGDDADHERAEDTTNTVAKHRQENGHSKS